MGQHHGALNFADLNGVVPTLWNDQRGFLAAGREHFGSGMPIGINMDSSGAGLGEEAGSSTQVRRVIR
jgi:hypothetical protein